ncbi:MAG: hypothetical protein IJR17_00885 [Clostridia bacterium]|nr:hypothetical protein [Clostridia bacterium]
MDKLTMEDIGYFLYMQEMEQKQQEEQAQALQTLAQQVVQTQDAEAGD